MQPRLLPFACAALVAALAACTQQEPVSADQAGNGNVALELPKEPPVTEEPPMRRMPGSDEALVRCDPDAARGAIGQEATAEVVEQARRDAGADLVRTLKPGQIITMEFHNSRLNLSVDDANVIVDVSCG